MAEPIYTCIHQLASMDIFTVLERDILPVMARECGERKLEIKNVNNYKLFKCSLEFHSRE